MRTSKIYFSLLFVPAEKKYLKKILSFSPDAFIIDLEDSIRLENKDEALMCLEEYLSEFDFSADLYIRLNKDRLNKEISSLNRFSIEGYMIPKVDSIEDLESIVDNIKDKKLLVLIESPLGIVNLTQIINHKSVFAVAFGAEDYSARLGIEPNEKALLYAKTKLITYAHAHYKQVFDTISLNYTKLTLLEAEVKESMRMGFTGKLAIHPNQIDVINNTFMDNDIEYYERIIKEYEASGKGIMILNGKVFEKPHIERYKNLLKRRKQKEIAPGLSPE